jgi:hypothetical protein
MHRGTNDRELVLLFLDGADSEPPASLGRPGPEGPLMRSHRPQRSAMPWSRPLSETTERPGEWGCHSAEVGDFY